MIDEENRIDRIDLSNIPSLVSLAVFERAATYSSFVQAASDLGKSPSAISHAINELEGRFGCSLFDRIGRTVRLTEAGTEYLRIVREALRLLDQGGRNIKGEMEDSVIRLRINPLVAKDLMIPRLGEFQKLYPGLELRFEVGRTPIDWNERDTDIEIRIGEVEDDRLFHCEIGKLGLIPICSRKLLEGGRELKEIADLEKFTVLRDALRPEGWECWLEAVGHPEVKLKHQLVLADIMAISAAMRNGIGLTLVPYPFVLNYPGYGTEVIMPFPDAELFYLHYKFICRKNSRNDRKIAIFRNWISGLFSENEEMVAARSGAGEPHMEI